MFDSYENIRKRQNDVHYFDRVLYFYNIFKFISVKKLHDPNFE